MFNLREMGPFQRRLLVSLLIVCMGHGTWLLGTIFTMATPDHRCAVPGYENDTYEIESEAQASLVNAYIPTDPKKGSYSQCFRYENVTSGLSPSPHSTRQTPCTHWVYSKAVYKSSLVSDLNLVCDREIYISHANMMSMAGLMIGSLCIGPLSDHFGRRKTLIMVLPAHVVIAVLSAFISSIPALLLSRLLGTILSVAVFSCAWCLGIETVSGRLRAHASTAMMAGWGCGALLVVLLAFGIRQWRTLHLALELPKILLAIVCPWLFSESPKWLISKGRHYEAKDVLKKVAQTEEVTDPDDLISTSHVTVDTDQEENAPSCKDGSQSAEPKLAASDSSVYESESLNISEEVVIPTPKKGEITQLLQSPTMMIRMSVLGLNWIVNTLVYFGFTLNIGSIIDGSLYMNMALALALELLITIMCQYGLTRCGRKPVFCTCMLISGLSCLATTAPLFLDFECAWINVVLANLGRVGIAGAFTTIWVYTSEVLPTTLRQSGIGFCSFLSRIGGIISPYISKLDVLVDGPMGKALPLFLFGVCSVVSGSLALVTLPETKGRKLPASVADAKKMRIRQSELRRNESEKVKETDKETTQKAV